MNVLIASARSQFRAMAARQPGQRVTPASKINFFMVKLDRRAEGNQKVTMSDKGQRLHDCFDIEAGSKDTVLYF
jgi:hypothetical protein